jgi:hypothetical protein
MKPFISSAFYGFFKYILSLTLIASPWIFGLVNVSSAALFMPIYFGWLQLIMNIFADTEASPIRKFPLQMNQVVDVMMGFVLMVSPWLYSFAEPNSGRPGAHWPELLFGALLMFLGFFTKKSPFLTEPHAVPEGQLNSVDSSEARLNI